MKYKRFASLLAACTFGTAAAGYTANTVWSDSNKDASEYTTQFTSAPSRESNLKRLQSQKEFDILVIGGGATGVGAALDATTRGLNVALVERDDFASGTSSRSTKLIHGGVRYLENAFLKLDLSSFSLVFEALHERRIFLDSAPHLTRPLPIMSPCYQFWEIPYFWFGLKVYDLLAGTQGLHGSRFLGYKESVRQFPMINKHDLKGSVIYYDGQMNDSRMNVSIAITAAMKGAAIANHVEVKQLLRDGEKIIGARVRDTITGNEWDIKAKVVINATGPFADSVRKMVNPSIANIIAPSSGVHIILPDYYAPQSMGMIVPKTKDGRVIFLLPWQGQTIAGTTDAPTELTPHPRPTESEVNFILETLANYMDVKVRKEDVTSAWSGIRPLVKPSTAKDTASISRDHLIEVLNDNVITIVGGKWTTYRRMAQDVVNKAIEAGELKPLNPCVTKNIKLAGAETWDSKYFTVLTQDYQRRKTLRNGTEELVRIPTDIALHLSESYGTRAARVAEIAKEGYGNRLADGYPYLEAEVIYAVKEEYACKAVDVLARRTRLAFLDVDASLMCVNRVVDLMGKTLNWDEKRKREEIADAVQYLKVNSVKNM